MLSVSDVSRERPRFSCNILAMFDFSDADSGKYAFLKDAAEKKLRLMQTCSKEYNIRK